MATEDEVLSPERPGIIGRIRQLFDRREKELELDKDTLAGIAVAATQMDRLAQAFQEPGPEVEAVYRDMRAMDKSLVEVQRALDILAEDSMAGSPEQRVPFRVMWENPSSRLEELVENLLVRLNFRQLLPKIAREMLLMGNDFHQLGINPEFQIVNFMYLPPESINIQTDQHQRLLPGGESQEKPAGWAYIQKLQGSFKAGYYPWEMVHAKRIVSGGSLYGTPLYHAARWPWRKLVAMEDALVLNWLTRAFARLLFVLDVSGKSDKEAQSFITGFKDSLEVARVGRARFGDMGLAMIKDIFIGKGYHELMGGVHPGLADVKVLDTSGSVFTDTQALEYFRGKILMSGSVPRAYLGLEENINAKATLSMEDRQYARTLLTVQTCVGNAISFAITVQMILNDIPPYENPFNLMWFNPSRADVVDDSTAQLNYARATDLWQRLGVLDAEYAATHYVNMSPSQWMKVMERMQAQAEDVEKIDDSEITNDTDQV